MIRLPASCTLVLIAGCSSADNNHTTAIRVEPTPVVDIYDAAASADPVFEFPTGGAVLSNGNIVVNDYYGAALAYFDPTGKLIRKVGGHGMGPNEFGKGLIWLGSCKPDSLFVFIFDKGHGAVIDSAGQIRRKIPTDMLHYKPCHNEPYGAAFNWTMTRIPREGDPPMRGKLIAGHIEEKPDTFGEFVIGEYGPLRPQKSAVVRGARVYIGSGEDGTIDVYSIKGKKLKTLNTGAQRRDVTADHYDAALERWVSYLVIKSEREQMKKMMRDLYSQPGKAPAYTSFYVDAERALWAVTSLPGESETRMRVIDVDNGALLGEISLPGELSILEIGKDYLLASFENEEGLPHVGKYTVRRD